MFIRSASAVLGLLLVWGATESAHAQFPNYSGTGRSIPSVRQRILDRPTVSPYMELLSPQGQGLPTYYTRVRPELEARALEQQAARQLSSLQSQVRAIQQQDARGSQFATGHPTRFMNYTHYFPGFYQR